MDWPSPSQSNSTQIFLDFYLALDLRNWFKSKEKIPHRNRSQVQVSLKVTAQIEHLNITVTLEFFKKFDIFSINQSPAIAGKFKTHVLDYK